MEIRISDRELGTILAALRFYQGAGLSSLMPPKASNRWLRNIATNGGKYVPMNITDIDALCERLNTGSIER